MHAVSLPVGAVWGRNILAFDQPADIQGSKGKKEGKSSLKLQNK